MRQLRDHGYRLFRRGRYTEAARVFEQGYEEAARLDQPGPAVKFLNNLGGCRVAMLRYREGMKAYLEAKALAEKAHDRVAAAALGVNISSLYLELSDLNAAVQSAEAALALVSRSSPPSYFPQLLTHLARLRARTGKPDTAIGLFYAAIDEADRAGDSAFMAEAWNQLGYEFLVTGQLDKAEGPLAAAYRIRKLSRDPKLPHSLRLLALLRLEQGDLGSAEALIGETFRSARHSPSLPVWQLYYDRGRLRMAQDRLEEAVADFRDAVKAARTWRLEVLPADSVRVGSEVTLQDIYSAFTETAARLYFQTGRRSLALEAFDAAEENRAASLRALLAAPEDWRQRLPAEYGEVLGRLRAAQAAALADTPQSQEQIAQLEHRLTEMEAAAGLGLGPQALQANPPGNLLERTRLALARDEAFISFHLGRSESLAWSITREGFALSRLPGRSGLEQRAQEFLEAVRGGASESGLPGRGLYAALCGSFSRRVQEKKRWLLGLEGALFEVPFPALVVSGETPGRPVYLVERHSIEIVPSAHMVAYGQPGGERQAAGPFLGVGDPIYNVADPRWRGGEKGRAAALMAAPLQLVRLPGSAREIRSCAAAAGPASAAPLLLEGPAASGPELRKALERGPAIVHLATHIVASKEKRGLLALSLLPNGEAQFLTPAEIASWRLKPALIVLSGCSSGRGETLPGTGLMGLTRSWLAAGASAVIASLWPTPDDSGQLFIAFYRNLRSSRETDAPRRPDAALACAQRQMLHSGTWRSDPKYWAAYFTFAKE